MCKGNTKDDEVMSANRFLQSAECLPEDATRDVIVERIESCCLVFLHSLLAARSRTHRVVFRLPADECNLSDYEIRLSRRHASRFAFCARALAQIYQLRITATFATKRDLFYDQKSLYGTQRNLDISITAVCRLLNASRSSQNVLSAGRGIVMGSLIVDIGGRRLDCSSAPVIISDWMHHAYYLSWPRFILVVEKDATFQKLIQEGFLSRFSSAILVTGKGYPDISTRKFLKHLTSTYQLPLFGLMDSDPHGIEIAMTYKYGGRMKSAEVGELSLPNFIWIGLSRSEICRYPIPREQFLPLQKAELKKTIRLCHRAAEMQDWTFLNELNCLHENGTKLELEAVSSIAPGFMCNSMLAEKLAGFLCETHSQQL
uniref:DNA topoisomerase (ATP-hydrolyzing) n=2 Tax=Parascaris univalens TaxID=6257 RepID=A0A915BHN0_PARUN